MSAAPIIAMVVGVLAIVLVVLFVWRLRSIAGRVGSFECALRYEQRGLHGVAVYTRDQLVWYEVASLSRRPKLCWDRDELMIVDRHPVSAAGRDLVEATCDYRGRSFVMTTERGAFAGLVSWLEAAPPGARNHPVI